MSLRVDGVYFDALFDHLKCSTHDSVNYADFIHHCSVSGLVLMVGSCNTASPPSPAPQSDSVV